jgi:hypothetical protein
MNGKEVKVTLTVIQIVQMIVFKAVMEPRPDKRAAFVKSSWTLGGVIAGPDETFTCNSGSCRRRVR